MLGFDVTIFKEPRSQLIRKILLVCFGEILLGFGIVFNSSAGFGNDSVTVFYDGLHKTIGVSFGFATNMINITLLIILLFLGRKYINIGTLIYALPLGSIINFAFKVYPVFNLSYTMSGRIASAVIGCLLLFVSLSCFVAAQIGVDPWNGVTLVLCDKTGMQYRVLKILIDVATLFIGLALGGSAGVTTVIAAILGGPLIQQISQWMRKFILEPQKT
ncbi:MAG: hypothetical protein RUMPE_00323 [Eubacteriales bacterium SKADARSKE-1]|nr:hypothetical protein [Eubacteriales bacterium SKADARSKE-1]